MREANVDLKLFTSGGGHRCSRKDCTKGAKSKDGYCISHGKMVAALLALGGLKTNENQKENFL